MSWAKREAVTPLEVLGDEQGQRRKIGGLLVGIPQDKGYKDKVNYELVQRDGEVLTLSGSSSLSRQINTDDIGKFIKCEFTGWGKSPNGKYKAIDVFVYEGEPTPDMKTWPRYAEFAHGNGKKAQSGKAAAPAAADDDFSSASEDADDDLPF